MRSNIQSAETAPDHLAPEVLYAGNDLHSKEIRGSFARLFSLLKSVEIPSNSDDDSPN